MKKLTISIEETFKYRRKVVVSIPEDMGEGEVEKLLDKVEWKSQQASDVPYVIQKENSKIIIGKYPDGDMDSPDDMSIEIEEYEIET